VIGGRLGVHAPTLGIDTTLPRIDLRMRVNGDRLRVGVRAWAQPEALPLTAVLDVDRARGNGEAWLGADPVDFHAWAPLLAAGGVRLREGKGELNLWLTLRDFAPVALTTDSDLRDVRIDGAPIPGMVRMIYVKAKSKEDLSTAEREITQLLRQRHRIGQKQENDFTIRNLTQILQASEQSAKMMTLLLGAIASVSLLVGGIGIMNIMLVSVTERTREIGIRMAVGAKTWDIRLQFIIEALTLSLLGGVVGIIIGVSTSMVLSSVAGWPTVISPFSVLLAFSFSGLVGIFFGFYPAYKASLLSPIDALRYE